jgi:hypothetical protein
VVEITLIPLLRINVKEDLENEVYDGKQRQYKKKVVKILEKFFIQEN